MIKQIILSIHHELPIGLSEEVLARLYKDEVRPFIRLFYARQEWPFTHYLCGESLQWLKAFRPEAISALGELVSRKQMELLGGAYYAALIPLLSLQDKTAQMVEMTFALREYFGKKPHGAYLNGDVWEPSLAHSIKTGDLSYTFVDRNHFILSGIANPGELFLTEEMGKTLAIFPFYRPNLEGDVDTEIEHILQIPCEGDGLLTLMTDARDVNALERLLNGLQSNGIVFTLPSKIMKHSNKPLSRVYLPASSGAVFHSHSHFYRNELFKHFSIRLFHAKSIHTALSVRQIKRDKSRKHIAIQSVLRAQNHHFYWHSRYGGFYSAFARIEAMNHLLLADQIVREADAIDYGLVRADFDMDGIDEALYQSALSNMFVHARGAVLFVLDFFPSSVSLLNVFNQSHVAGYSRAFHDFFFDRSFSYQQWVEEASIDESGEFINSVYDLVQLRGGTKQVRYYIERNFDETLLALQKEYRFYPAMLEVKYLFNNHALGYVRRKLGIELNFSLDDSYKILVDGIVHTNNSLKDIQVFTLCSVRHRVNIIIESSLPITLWHKSLYGHCHGVGVHHQGVSILLLHSMNLQPTEQLALDITLKLEVLNSIIKDNSPLIV